MQFIVRVGATKGAKPPYDQCSGYNFIGPMNSRRAQEFRNATERELMRLLSEHGIDSFVYGEPELEVISLISPEDWTPERAARNWVLTPDDEEQLAL